MTTKKSAAKGAKTKPGAQQANTDTGVTGKGPQAGDQDTLGNRQAKADRDAAGMDGNEADIRRARNSAGAGRAEAAMSGNQAAIPGEATQATSSEQAAFGKKYGGAVQGVSGAAAGPVTDAATSKLSEREDVVAKHTAGASHGALSTSADMNAGQIDPSPEGVRPKGGGSPTLGEHVPGDTQFAGSRGLADRSAKAGAKSEIPRGYIPGKSAESEQRDQAAGTNQSAISAAQRQGATSKGSGSVKLLFVCTELRHNGPADSPPNTTTAILKAAPPGLSETNAEFFAVQPSGTIALNAFDPKHDELFVMGGQYEVTLAFKK